MVLRILHVNILKASTHRYLIRGGRGGSTRSLDLRRKGNMDVGEEPAVRGRNPVGEREIVGVQRSLAHSSDDQLRSAGASACATTHLANH